MAPFNLPNQDQYIEVVDEFIQASYDDPETGITIGYNLFVPEGYEAKADSLEDLPMVFFLHGGGETGYDNRGQVVCYRQVEEYVREQAQAETPCFVMMPQCPMTEERAIELTGTDHGWNTHILDENDVQFDYPSKALEASINAMLAVAQDYNVDMNRVYSMGHSMGGGGSIASMIARPDVFAASAVFASATRYHEETLEPIKDKPIIFTVAENERIASIYETMPDNVAALENLGVNIYHATGDEAWDASLRGEAAQAEAEATIANAEAAGASMIYVEFMKGSVVMDSHHSHRASFENAGIRHWLFEQTLN